ncbi:hypothetical protein GCM10007897_05820 [Sphingobium jiangsuense]|uniref:DNA topoisomerase n=1 Tax=Sphingobium jiangsuense TaxID=870476 RepID=A0A7W6FPX8_9SPHN|nr:DNA topoisomerase IB [Sphingobium jiangsuense]MBB3926082.1 DNA topoisomerase-1 [Sphingobium jiangsuense]GLS99203.1 hypothetical protein GCM10007897_05820 [Sphingobium jiangsuense]
MACQLVFVDTGLPGIRRKRAGRGWAYYTPEGQRIVEREEIDRLNAVGLPPAYRNAWFCTCADGHILATGIDARGRKQYRYHPLFRTERDCLKFDALARFGTLLPRIRRRVATDITARGLTRERAIACVVRLLDQAALRVGNEAYTRSNKSFGATTLRMRHVAVVGRALRLRFRAKSGKMRETLLTDRGLLRFVRAMQDLRGQHLFQFLGEDGQPVPVDSGDVNDYLRATLGEDFTAKHFRTWAATVQAFELVRHAPGTVTMKEMLAHVAERLGNTPAIARKSYIHPALLRLAGDAAAQQELRLTPLPRSTRWLSRAERGLIAFLEKAPDTATLLAA